MTSPVAQMFVEMIQNGDLDQDPAYIKSNITARELALSTPTVSTVYAAPLAPPGPKFKPGQRVKFRNWPIMKGVIEQQSTGRNRWIVRPDVMDPVLAKYEMKRYPGCVSFPDYYLEPA